MLVGRTILPCTHFFQGIWVNIKLLFLNEALQNFCQSVRSKMWTKPVTPCQFFLAFSETAMELDYKDHWHLTKSSTCPSQGNTLKEMRSTDSSFRCQVYLCLFKNLLGPLFIHLRVLVLFISYWRWEDFKKKDDICSLSLCILVLLYVLYWI